MDETKQKKRGRPPGPPRIPMHVQVDPEALAAAKDFVHRKTDGAEVSNSYIVNASMVFMGTSEKTMNAAFNERVEQEVAKNLEISVPWASAYAYRDGLREAGIADAEVLIDPGPPIGPVVSFKNRLGQIVEVDFRLHHADPKITKRWEAC